jgi:hypothetical protein
MEIIPHKKKKEKESTNLKLVTTCRGDPMRNKKTIKRQLNYTPWMETQLKVAFK